jgi:predicted RNA polymerase sigma factor
MWLATYADLHRRLGHEREAEAFYAKAMALAPPIEREMLARRMRRERPRGG